MSDERDSNETARGTQRRTILKACCAFALTAPAMAARGDETDEASAPPQTGDALVFAFGKRAGQIMAPADLKVGSKQVLAFPMSPTTMRVRDGSRLNQLVVVRLDPAQLAGETATRAADGVVAYSGVCSHTGCDVTDWFNDKLHFKCPCHESEFDPSDAARVISGPAPWQLAALPLKIEGDAIVVAGPFVGRLGFAQPGGPPGP
ncbi:MAG: Rieske 2Fe-2S domain-containing protein [Gammaproteobacteria bacterium]